MQDVERWRPVAIVIGSGELGSAIAIALHRAGYAVVLTDEIDPGWPRRGMAFTNAWYIGNAELDGEGAVFCASLKSIPSVLDRRRAIAATSWSWAGVAASLEPIAIVNATLRAPETHPPSEARDALTIVIEADHVAGASADVVVACPAQGAGAATAGDVVKAPRNGRFVTGHRIGDRVVAGDIVGAMGTVPVAAPGSGVLRGLSARGSRVHEGAPIVEVDPRGDPVLCFGLEDRAVMVAHDVLRAIEQRRAIPANHFNQMRRRRSSASLISDSPIVP